MDEREPDLTPFGAVSAQTTRFSRVGPFYTQSPFCRFFYFWDIYNPPSDEFSFDFDPGAITTDA